MQPLENHRNVLTKMSMCLCDKNEWRREKVIRILSNVILFILFVNFFVSSAVFMWKSVNLEDKLFVLFQIGAGLVVIYPFIVMILQRRKTTTIFENLNEFYNKCKK